MSQELPLPNVSGSSLAVAPPLRPASAALRAACQALASQDLAESVRLLNIEDVDPPLPPEGSEVSELFFDLLLLNAKGTQAAILKTFWVQKNKRALISALSGEIRSWQDYQGRLKLRERWLKARPRDEELKYYDLSEKKFKRIYLVQCLIYLATHATSDSDFERMVQAANELWNPAEPSYALLESYMIVPTVEYHYKIARGGALFLLHREKFILAKGPLEELSKKTYNSEWRNLLDMVFYHLFSHREDDLISAVFHKYPSLKTEFFFALFAGFQGEWDADMVARLTGIFGEDLSDFYRFVLETVILRRWPEIIPLLEERDIQRVFSISIELAQHQSHRLRDALLDRDFLGRSPEICAILMLLCVFYRFPEGMQLINRFVSKATSIHRFKFSGMISSFDTKKGTTLSHGLCHSIGERVLHPEEYFLLLSSSVAQCSLISGHRLFSYQLMLKFFLNHPEVVVKHFYAAQGVEYDFSLHRLIVNYSLDKMVETIGQYASDLEKRKVALPDELLTQFSEKYLEVLPAVLGASRYLSRFFRPVFLREELLRPNVSEPDQDCLMELEIERRMLEKYFLVFEKDLMPKPPDEQSAHDREITRQALFVVCANTAVLFQNRGSQMTAVEVHEEPALAPE